MGNREPLVVELDGTSSFTKYCIGHTQIAEVTSLGASILRKSGRCKPYLSPLDSFPRMLTKVKTMRSFIGVTTTKICGLLASRNCDPDHAWPARMLLHSRSNKAKPKRLFCPPF